jgi:hypothetical protein
MAGTRALFASLGASAALVAAAALSLLTVSVVFAFGGWTDPPSASLRGTQLIFAPPVPESNGRDGRASLQTASARPIVADDPMPRHKPAAAPAPREDHAKIVRAAGTPVTRKPAAPTPTPGLDAAKPRPAAPAPPPAVATARKGSGDGVRKVGDDLSSTVQGTGNALAQATAPLAAPISTAVQEVFNAVAALLTQTTQGLGAALDALLPPKK